jgi:hypothetical protein
MSKRIHREPRNMVSMRKPTRPSTLRFEQRISVGGTLQTVVAMRAKGNREIDVRSVHELKAENDELRNTAIQLVFDIQDLRLGRGSVCPGDGRIQ